jgi:transposase
MAKKSRLSDPKLQALREQRALYPHPESVKAEGFGPDQFLDPRDLVQVKYEMLREHRLKGRPVKEVSREFGVSRQGFYLAEAAFEQEGMPGLLPRRRGPKGAHKCTDSILDFVAQWREAPGSEPSVVEAIEDRFGVRLHPRSIDRALARRKKKPRAQRHSAK